MFYNVNGLRKALQVTGLWLLTGISIHSAQAQVQQLYNQFQDPPLSARPRALWTWVDGNFDKASITLELEEAKNKGMGGFDIWDVHHVTDFNNIIPVGKPFMSPEYADAIAHAINEATRLDLELGLVLASGWNSGGAWTRPEHATMGMFKSVVTVSGNGSTKTVKIPYPKLPTTMGTDTEVRKSLIDLKPNGKPVFERPIACIAFPLQSDSVVVDISKVIDITDKLDSNGILSWNVPAGKWCIVRMLCTNTGQPMIASSPASIGPMIDHFNPKATEAHVQYFVDQLLPRIGAFEGKALKYFYSDSYEVVGELWTPLMLTEFKNRKGYDMIPFLPVLHGFTVINKDASARFMYDYRQVLSDLIIENHFVKAKQKCNAYGIGYVAEAAGPGKPLHNCPFESLKSSGVLTHPRGEFWHNTNDQKNTDPKFDILQVIKGVASASHLYNQKIIDAEAFTSVWLWQESLDELKPTADNAFCEGLNRIVFHTFPHVPKAAGKPGWIYAFGTQISVTQPWWPQSKPFMQYLGRCSHMLQQGNFYADILYYYGDEAPNFVPNKHYDQARGFGYDYDVCNTDIICNNLKVTNGLFTLKHGPGYKILVLPNSTSIPLHVLQKIDTLVQQGGVVVGPKPYLCTGYKDYVANNQKVAALASKIWGATNGSTIVENTYGKGKVFWGISEKEVLQRLKVGPDVQPAPNQVLSTDSVDFIHRKLESSDLFFVRSKYAAAKKVMLQFRVVGKKVSLWNPLNGQVYVPASTETDGYTSVEVPFERFGSYFVVFSTDNTPSVALNTLSSLSTPLRSTVIAKNWQVQLPPSQSKTNSMPVQLPLLTDLSTHPNETLRYFSGIATYTNTFTLSGLSAIKKPIYTIDLGDVAIAAEVFVNGTSVGIVWNKPFRLDITNWVKNGTNSLRIEVSNRWVNQLVGDAKKPASERSTSTNATKLPNGWMFPFAKIPTTDYALPPSGLLGPVQLLEFN